MFSYILLKLYLWCLILALIARNARTPLCQDRDNFDKSMRLLVSVLVFFAAATPLIANQSINPKYNRDHLSGEYRCRAVRADIEAVNDQLALITRFRREELALRAKECGLQYTRLNR